MALENQSFVLSSEMMTVFIVAGVDGMMTVFIVAGVDGISSAARSERERSERFCDF
ncbi:hypothetical protein F2Q68_00031921 [Brassica cretica]|uniref:Uncharacterized protein n=1 Tax=Brassica cretica TaxID=69181 RepID=A0A8S9GIS8_BRACR|nr:hypothetical protein F2Q68_00031921 [Brassica cretica]